MFFASTVGSPAASLIRGRTFSARAKAVGVVLGADLMAATYQVAYEETRNPVGGMRQNSAHRRARNDLLMLILLGSKLPIKTQEGLRRSRDVVGARQRLLTNPKLPPNQHAVIHAAITKVIHRGVNEDRSSSPRSPVMETEAGYLLD